MDDSIKNNHPTCANSLHWVYISFFKLMRFMSWCIAVFIFKSSFTQWKMCITRNRRQNSYFTHTFLISVWNVVMALSEVAWHANLKLEILLRVSVCNCIRTDSQFRTMTSHKTPISSKCHSKYSCYACHTLSYGRVVFKNDSLPPFKWLRIGYQRKKKMLSCVWLLFKWLLLKRRNYTW